MNHILALSSGPALDPALRITVNFHPDRAAGGQTVLAVLAEDGMYRSQFVTGTSNGSLTAHRGGDRWRWESELFAGAYDNAPPDQRPVYGALNFRNSPFGAAPRFGSSHLQLSSDILGRVTFCYPDSSAEPRAFGTAARMSLIDLARAGTGDALYNYIEAHVHGPVPLIRHVEALVLDPCYRGTEVEAAAGQLPFPMRWHSGLRLTVAELRLHPEYRGPEFVGLGAEIAEDGILDPRVIGDAVRTGHYHPQALKQVWHYVARFGTGAVCDTGTFPPD